MILKLLWPEICPFCGRLNRNGICPACKIKLKELIIGQPRCMKCGKPIGRMEKEYCPDCDDTIHYYDVGRALWIHKSPVNESIYQFKYHNQREFGKYYAKEMAKQFESIVCEWKPDVIIPVPLHFRRKRKRGYNQSQIIAEKLGEILDIPVDVTILKRVKYTNPQKKLDHNARRKNLHNAFRVAENRKGIKSVLLVDDIYTTGNTIDEAARKLKQAGVEKVYFLTVSIGQGH